MASAESEFSLSWLVSAIRFSAGPLQGRVPRDAQRGVAVEPPASAHMLNRGIVGSIASSALIICGWPAEPRRWASAKKEIPNFKSGGGSKLKRKGVGSQSRAR
jgi:hypothetical protein